jgi:N,N-dimethylformamidase
LIVDDWPMNCPEAYMDDVIGYLGDWSVRAGDTVSVHLYAAVSTPVMLDLVSLIRTDDADVAPPVALVPSTSAVATPQHTPIGSYAVLPLPSLHADGGLTVICTVRPTTAQRGVVLALCSVDRTALSLQWNGADAFELMDGNDVRVSSAPALRDGWTSVAVQIDRDRCAVSTWPANGASPATDAVPSTLRSAMVGPLSLWLAAQVGPHARAQHNFDGALDAPSVFAEWLPVDRLRAAALDPAVAALDAAVVGAWDFSLACDTWTIIDRGPQAVHGQAYQGPTRLMPGARWTPGVLDPTRAPWRFSSIHFHSDDLLDAQWAIASTIALPTTLASSVYGVRVRDLRGLTLDVMPLWVRSAPLTAAHSVAFLAPTYTYLAYGNASDAMLGPPLWGATSRSERQRRAHPEYGPSLYSRHPDHSGVSLASRHRPLLSVRPGVRPWGFEADRLLTDWLARHDVGFDVLTDDALDCEERSSLDPYRVLVTGNHPEYYSARMLDALEEWLRDGGRLVYLGGNGFYWRVSSLAELPGVIECRRAEGGTRPWSAAPGTYHHQLDGEPGGLWRRLGRPPQQLVGVGFSAQGFGGAAPYRVRESARSTWAAFALDGVDEPLIGETGVLGGGAAGQEIDRFDTRLGSRADAVVIASSQGLHDATMLRTVEELLSHEPAVADAKVRADMTLTALPGGGGVFAAGSMSMVGALDDPGIERVLRNVLDRFTDPRPLTQASGELASNPASEQ